MKEGRDSPPSPALLTSTDALLLLTTLIWGVNFIVVKAALGVFQPLAFNALRFAIAAAALLLIWAVLPERLPARQYWKPLAISGIVGTTLYQLGFIEGIARTRAGNAALLMAAVPVFTAVMSHSRGHDRLRWRDAAGLALSLIGVTFVVVGGGVEFGFGATIVGDLMVLAGTVCWAAYTVAAKPLVDAMGTVTVTVWSTAIGTVPIVLMGVPSLISQDWSRAAAPAWGAVLYSALLSLTASYIMWNRGVKRLGPSRVAQYSNVTPVFALLAAWPMLGEVPTWWQVLGGVAIFWGMYVTRS